MSRHLRPERQPELPALLRRPASAGARPCQGRSSLDRTCAPAEYGSYQAARTGKISHIKVSTLSGEPRRSFRDEDLLVVRGGVEPPTFRFSGGFPRGPERSARGRVRYLPAVMVA